MLFCDGTQIFIEWKKSRMHLERGDVVVNPMLGAAAASYAMPPSLQQICAVMIISHYDLRQRRTSFGFRPEDSYSDLI